MTDALRAVAASQRTTWARVRVAGREWTHPHAPAHEIVACAASSEAQGGMNRVRANLASRVKKGKMTQAAADQAAARVKGTLTYDEFRNVDIVIEAVGDQHGCMHRGVGPALAPVTRRLALRKSHSFPGSGRWCCVRICVAARTVLDLSKLSPPTCAHASGAAMTLQGLFALIVHALPMHTSQCTRLYLPLICVSGH